MLLGFLKSFFTERVLVCENTSPKPRILGYHLQSPKSLAVFEACTVLWLDLLISEKWKASILLASPQFACINRQDCKKCRTKT